ncbi:hypothetical protein SESBI_41389 [Sesbania bispinosa]|nr:hypothetical protein SESBI_41389 [Sesbania bispinosa]
MKLKSENVSKIKDLGSENKQNRLREEERPELPEAEASPALQKMVKTRFRVSARFERNLYPGLHLDFYCLGLLIMGLL